MKYKDGLYKTAVVYGKPVYIGCAVIGIIKVRMMGFIMIRLIKTSRVATT